MKITKAQLLEELYVQSERLNKIRNIFTKSIGHIKIHNKILKTLLEGKKTRGRWEDKIREWSGYSLQNVPSLKGN